ncbi:TPA: hypothetical protein QDB43_000316 [Burkholderia vietnamiensis]|uniref:hypothetical protein n=1 Tax=Burkholderia cepacia TaxID=292 RepID=UPI0032F8413D|nr:hypothetical protein [Burkholderia vietnamiensis]
MAKNSKNGKTAAKGTNGTVWEDTVIIAFRDMQWDRWRKGVQQKVKEGDALKALLESSPADLHKLDDDAESAFGDTITSQNARYFLFEFKAVRAGHIAERGKGMFERLSHVAAQKSKAHLFDLSRRCHFGVFAKRAPVTAPPNLTDMAQFMYVKNGQPSRSPELSAVKLQLLVDPYLDWVELANRSLAHQHKKGTLAKDLAVAFKAAKKAADAWKMTFLKARGERAAIIADEYGDDEITRIEIDQLNDPLSLESVVWPSTLPAQGQEPAHGVGIVDLASYLVALMDLPEPGAPDGSGGGTQGDSIRFNIVRVVDGEVVQWTLSGKQVRESLQRGRLAKILRDRAKPDEKSDADKAEAPPSPPAGRTRYSSVGGTEQERSTRPEDQ